jgi:DNA-binding NtrC family response regulator
MNERKYDVLLLDIQMRTPREGLDALPRIRSLHPDTMVIITSGLQEQDVRQEALDLGAHDFLAKDFEPLEIAHRLDTALERLELQESRQSAQREIDETQRRHTLVGNSPAIQEVRRLIEKFRGREDNVLITGETGTGKEIVARLLRHKDRRGAWVPFISVDSSTILSSTAESLLFGHERGAFTGATETARGFFEEANGGILYFDELGNMPLEIQAKLLRVLQEKEVRRLGSQKIIQLNFRVIGATNLNLALASQRDTFKHDLYHRLQALPISLPPLRERKEDIPLLVQHLCILNDWEQLEFDRESLDMMHAYSWPGNVRELYGVVRHAYAMADGESPYIRAQDLPSHLRIKVEESSAEGSEGTTTSQEEATPFVGRFFRMMQDYERTVLERELNLHSGNVKKTAAALGMDRSHLSSKLKKHGIARTTKI